MGYEGPDAAQRLLEELDLRRTRLRTIFDACFSREQERATSL
jgi:hypothetical protein